MFYFIGPFCILQMPYADFFITDLNLKSSSEDISTQHALKLEIDGEFSNSDLLAHFFWPISMCFHFGSFLELCQHYDDLDFFFQIILSKGETRTTSTYTNALFPNHLPKMGKSGRQRGLTTNVALLFSFSNLHIRTFQIESFFDSRVEVEVCQKGETFLLCFFDTH